MYFVFNEDIQKVPCMRIFRLSIHLSPSVFPTFQYKPMINPSKYTTEHRQSTHIIIPQDPSHFLLYRLCVTPSQDVPRLQLAGDRRCYPRSTAPTSPPFFSPSPDVHTIPHSPPALSASLPLPLPSTTSP